MVEQGTLRPDDLIWRDGLDDWVSLASQRLLPPPPPPVLRAASTSPQRRASANGPLTYSPKAVVWSVVGIIAVFLCVAWWYASQPDTALQRVARSASKIPPVVEHHSNATKQRVAAVPNPESQQGGREEASNSLPRVKKLESPPSLAGTIDPSRMPPIETPSEVATPTIATVVPRSQSNPATAPAKQTASASGALYQVVDIRREPSFSVQGLTTKQSLHYQVSSQLNVADGSSDGFTNVVQIVLDTRLLSADEVSKANFAKALEDLKRQQYTYLLNHFGEVIEFTGHKKSRATMPVDLASAAGFQLTSVIDEDGWKELAELTFVRPPPDVAPADSWQRQMSHDWGTLGSWAGLTSFEPQPATASISKITFVRHMNYRPPDGGGEGIPFKISSANFTIQRASGSIDFDSVNDRVLHATEDFQVTGKVTAELTGIGVDIQLKESQRITIDISDQIPALQ